ncbi:MAG: aldehyde dehydrogenase family protein, partial [Bdellovibrionales bacterium]|nr:aldehyde dehydrogenase family protein [Bdellovibrionales bacterium]
MLEEVSNEPVLGYRAGSVEREELKDAIADTREQAPWNVPLVIGGKRETSDRTFELVVPHDHRFELGKGHLAGEHEVERAVRAAEDARKEWSQTSLAERVAIFLKAADLLAGPWRQRLNAATIVGQSKNPYEAEIDAAAELIDFLRFNALFASRIYEEQPLSTASMSNHTDYRPLEGFVLAITPFNFTSIGGNLPLAPILMGNVALWKPSPKAALSNYLLVELMEEAGLPPGVLNFLPGEGADVAGPALRHRLLAGLHFTG